MTFLICDTNLQFRSLLAAYIRMVYKMKTLELSSMAEAARLLEKQSFVLIISDLENDFSHHHKMYGKIPHWILTSQAQELQGQTQKHGVVRVFSKYRLQELINALDVYVSGLRP